MICKKSPELQPRNSTDSHRSGLKTGIVGEIAEPLSYFLDGLMRSGGVEVVFFSPVAEDGRRYATANQKVTISILGFQSMINNIFQ